MGHGGNTLHKTVRVETNDINHPRFTLVVTGPVDKFVTIKPVRVRLQGEPGVPLSQIVDIIPEKKYPFKILSHKAKYGDSINYTFEQVSSKEGKNYRVVINNTMNVEGRYSDRIILTTDSKIQPEIIIYISGYIFEKRKKQNTNPMKPEL